MRTQLRHILRSRHIIDLAQSMRIREERVVHVERLGLAVHLVQKHSYSILLTAADVCERLQIVDELRVEFGGGLEGKDGADGVGEGVGCIVAAWQHHTEHQVVDRDLHALFEEGSGAGYVGSLFGDADSPLTAVYLQSAQSVNNDD
jgi:hypothetical protein